MKTKSLLSLPLAACLLLAAAAAPRAVAQAPDAPSPAAGRPGALVLPAVTKASMRACVAACAGGVVRVTDGERGEWFNNGSGWRRLRNYIDVSLDFGAKGDGAADDTAAFNAAVEALNDAASSVRQIHVGAGTFRLTAPLRPITRAGKLYGDGRSDAHFEKDSTPAYVTQIAFDAPTGTAFTVNANKFLFEDFLLRNTARSTPTGGAGILVTNSKDYLQKVDFNRVTVWGFYDNWDIQVGDNWTMFDSYGVNPVRYGIRIQNTVVPDAGGWSITASHFLADRLPAPDAAIRVESCGGGHIVHTNILRYKTAVSAVGSLTSVLNIDGGSFENLKDIGVDINGWSLVNIYGTEIGMYDTSDKQAIRFTNVKWSSIDNVILRAPSSQGQVGVSIIDCVGFNQGRIVNSGFHHAVGYSGSYAHDAYRRNVYLAPAFQNGWGNIGGNVQPAGYNLFEGNRVELTGTVGGGALGSVIFNIAEPIMRPARTLIFSVPCGEGHCQVYVNAEGNVVLYRGTTIGSVSLDGINYRP